jgi:uncharacterized protein YbjT (DUF2867 family)
MTPTQSSPILVTGGTGTLGRLVVDRLRAAGHGVRVLSRQAHDGPGFVVSDLATGDGIDAALAGVEVIVHCAGSAKGDEAKARTLVAAASRAGARPHVVNISVVGADRIPQAGRFDRAMFGYFGAKLAAEQVVEESGLPWTTLRATQFHDLVLKVARGMARLPVVPVPSGFRFQPVDSGEVADRMVALALGAPAGLVPDLAGPAVHPLAGLVRSYLEAMGRHRLLVPVRIPGKAARAVREGAVLAPDRAVGERSWEEFLAGLTSSRSSALPS